METAQVALFAASATSAIIPNSSWLSRKIVSISTSNSRAQTERLTLTGFSRLRRPALRATFEENGNHVFVDDLSVPQEWMQPSIALEESEWLRKALHKWLDEEYCPEAANVEISKRCAKAYYECLKQKRSDVGEILMAMVRNLESFSFKESFHGAFSSANAAVNLIITRIEATQKASE